MESRDELATPLPCLDRGKEARCTTVLGRGNHWLGRERIRMLYRAAFCRPGWCKHMGREHWSVLSGKALVTLWKLLSWQLVEVRNSLWSVVKRSGGAHRCRLQW